MGLVDGECVDAEVLDGLQKPGCHQTLGRHEGQPALTGGDEALRRGALLGLLGAVQRGSRVAVGAQPVDLILHQ